MESKKNHFPDNVADELLKSLPSKQQWFTRDFVIEQGPIGDIDYFKLKRAMRGLKEHGLIEVGKPARLAGAKAMRLTKAGLSRQAAILAFRLSSRLNERVSRGVAPVVASAMMMSACSTTATNFASSGAKPISQCRLGGIPAQARASSVEGTIDQVTSSAACGPFKPQGQAHLTIPSALIESSRGVLPSPSGTVTNTPPSAAASLDKNVAPKAAVRRTAPVPIVSAPVDRVAQQPPTLDPKPISRSSSLAANTDATGMVFFDTGSAQISLAGRQALHEAVSNAPIHGVFAIFSSTDATGSLSLNEKLAKARALSVAHELVRHGVLRKHIVVKSVPMNRSNLALTNESPLRSVVPSDSNAQARRAELRWLPKSEAARSLAGYRSLSKIFSINFG